MIGRAMTYIEAEGARRRGLGAMFALAFVAGMCLALLFR